MSNPQEREIIIDAEGGEDIDDFCRRLAFLTWAYGSDLSGRFNDCWLHASRGMTAKQIKEPWVKMQFDSYFGNGEWDRRRGEGATD